MVMRMAVATPMQDLERDGDRRRDAAQPKAGPELPVLQELGIYVEEDPTAPLQRRAPLVCYNQLPVGYESGSLPASGG